MNANPLVSVIIACYKHEAFIRDAVLSARQQTYANVEVVVVDDGSPEPVAPLLKDLHDVLVVRIENSGPSAAKNFGVTKSKGDYLVFLDSDDRLLPGAVETGLRALSRHPGAGLAFGAVRRVDERGDVTRQAHVCKPRNDYFLMLLESCPIECPAAAIVRRDVFVEVGNFDEQLKISYDYDLYLRIARRNEVVRHKACVADYRHHGSNISLNKQGIMNDVSHALGKVETEGSLTAAQRRRLSHGRKRWRHALQPRAGLGYKLQDLYFSFRAMLTVNPSSYIGR